VMDEGSTHVQFAKVGSALRTPPLDGIGGHFWIRRDGTYHLIWRRDKSNLSPGEASTITLGRYSTQRKAIAAAQVFLQELSKRKEQQ
jgi:hypothetical protein